MTSTVIDVTVLLLCVSASVVVLGGVDSTPFEERDSVSAERAAERLSTETATISLHTPSDDSTRDGRPVPGNRTVHTTLSDLLVLASLTDRPNAENEVTEGGSMVGRTRSREQFVTAVIESVSKRLGPRVRIDLRPDTSADPDPGSPRPNDGSTSRSAVYDGWYLSALYRPSAHAETRRDIERLAVGTAPPRRADVTVALVTVPLLDVDTNTERVHIVVRVW